MFCNAGGKIGVDRCSEIGREKLQERGQRALLHIYIGTMKPAAIAVYCWLQNMATDVGLMEWSKWSQRPNRRTWMVSWRSITIELCRSRIEGERAELGNQTRRATHVFVRVRHDEVNVTA